MARGKGRSGRRYMRDAKGRFASTGYVGQTGGRGARLKSAGKKREGGGEKVKISSTKQSGIIRRSNKKPTAAKMPQVSSARQAATDRLKIKTQTRRAIRADRASVITPGQRSRLETGKGATIKSARLKATVAKPRTKGNKPATVARRVDRKAAVNQANIRNITQKERTGATQGRQYQRALKTQATLKRAQEFTKTSKLPGRDNSIKAQRERKAAGERLAAKRAARQRGDTASVNVPMSGSRGRRLNAEISRNVKQQQTTKRAESRARNAQFKSDQSRAKALRGKYGDQLAKNFAAKSGRKVSEVKATIKGMAPAQQVKLLTQAGRQQRATANLARTADTRNKPGSTMIRRPSAKQNKSNRRAQTALDIYGSSGTKRSQLIRNQARLARTERARGNQLPTRDVRVAQAKAANLPLIKVTKSKKSDYDMAMKKAPKRRRR